MTFLRNYFLEALIQDPTPQLGGPLQSKGQQIQLSRSDDTVRALLEARPSDDQAAFAYSRDGAYTPGDGAITLGPAEVGLFGTSVTVDELQHSIPNGRQVYVSTAGILYAVDPPPTGWSASDTSLTTQDLGTGTGAGTWFSTGIAWNFPEDIQIGQRLDISLNLYIENRTDDKAGNVSIGFGFNAAAPAAPSATVTIGEYFEGWVPVAFSIIAGSAYTTSDRVDIFIRRESSADSNFNPWLVYNGVDQHNGILSTPGSTPGAAGDVVQGVGGASAEFGVWQDFDGKLLNGAGFGPSVTARTDATQNFTAGSTHTSFGVASAASVTLDAANGQIQHFTDTTTPTEIQALTADTSILVKIPAGLSVSFAAGVIVEGAQPASGDAFGTLARIDGTTFWVWGISD